MHTRQEAKDILNEMMEKIEEDKENLTDAEYLELCNRVKFFFNEIKKTKFGDDNSDDDDDDDYIDMNEIYFTGPIELLIAGYLRSVNVPEDDLPDSPLNIYNDLLAGICEKYQEPRNFKCLCGQCINTAIFGTHIQEEEHTKNFKVPTIEEYEASVEP
jgi:hypothetical protein